MILNQGQKPIERVMDTAFDKIRGLIDADTIIGKTLVLSDGTSIIPISHVTLGFLTGGGEYSDINGRSSEYPFAGGSGVGVSVTPIGFLIDEGKGVKMITIGDKSLYDKILSMIPDALEAVTDVIKNKI